MFSACWTNASHQLFTSAVCSCICFQFMWVSISLILGRVPFVPVGETLASLCLLCAKRHLLSQPEGILNLAEGWRWLWWYIHTWLLNWATSLSHSSPWSSQALPERRNKKPKKVQSETKCTKYILWMLNEHWYCLGLQNIGYKLTKFSAHSYIVDHTHCLLRSRWAFSLNWTWIEHLITL